MRTCLTLAVAALLGLGAAAPALAEPAPEPDAASPWVELHASRARLVASAAKTAGGGRLAGLEIVARTTPRTSRCSTPRRCAWRRLVAR